MYYVSNFILLKKSIKKIRRQATDWEKIFTKHVSAKGLVSKIYKNSKLANKKTTIYFKMGERSEQTPYQRNIQKAKKNMKRCFTSHVTRELQ